MAEPRPYPTSARTQFALATRRQDGVVVVEVEGELDTLSCGRLQESLLHLLDSGERDAVLDLARVRYCDATGVQTLAAAAARFERNHGNLRVRDPEGLVREEASRAGVDLDLDLDADLGPRDRRVRERRRTVS